MGTQNGAQLSMRISTFVYCHRESAVAEAETGDLRLACESRSGNKVRIILSIRPTSVESLEQAGGPFETDCTLRFWTVIEPSRGSET
jgi:hypothetical protein